MTTKGSKQSSKSARRGGKGTKAPLQAPVGLLQPARQIVHVGRQWGEQACSLTVSPSPSSVVPAAGLTCLSSPLLSSPLPTHPPTGLPTHARTHSLTSPWPGGATGRRIRVSAWLGHGRLRCRARHPETMTSTSSKGSSSREPFAFRRCVAVWSARCKIA